MTWRIKGALAAAALVWGLAGPAHASATYVFRKTGGNPAALPVEIGMTFAGPGTSIVGDAFGGGFDGLLDFSFRLGTVDIDLADLQAVQQTCAPPSQNPFCQPFTLSYALAPAAGFLQFNNLAYNLAFTYGGAFLSGSFNTDGPGAMACLQTGVCRYEGQWLTVPEPATAGLLALGLAGILGAAVRRRSGFVPIGRRRAALVNR